MKHGGDLISYRHLHDGEIIDFSSNINPLGYPAILDEIIPNSLSALTAYPDIHYRALREAIAAYLRCQPDEVLVGNGSVDILDYFCRKAQRIVVCLPCFGEYLDRPPLYGTPVKKLRLPDDFQVSASLFEAHVTPGDALLLGNPNNPTGLRISATELRRLSILTEQRGAFLLLDEAFVEFCPDEYDSIDLFYGQKHVCVIRAATKFFGLPGLRLGYAYAVSEIADSYHANALPWRINAIADAVGQAIFQQTDYIAATKRYVHEQRQWMVSQLRAMKGVRAYPTDANFILLKLLDVSEDILFDRLIRQGFLIRKASSYEGLDQSYIRIAVKDRADNQRFLHALAQALLPA